jgi:Holliday junction resolvasome RuvABC endonuclease subunit
MTAILTLDLGTKTGWAAQLDDGAIISGTKTFKPGRFEGGGMRYLRFSDWLNDLSDHAGPFKTIWFEEVRSHKGVDAAHAYGGFLATLTQWAEKESIPYAGVSVGTIKKHATGQGNANKDAMIEAVKARGFKPQDDNEADAIALLLWAVDKEGAK